MDAVVKSLKLEIKMSNIIRQLVDTLEEIWSLTNFNRNELTDYAKNLIFLDTRRGIIILCWVMFLMLGSFAILYHVLGYTRIYVYSFAILALLSLHMSISARVIRETRVLYLLGTTLLVINGVAMVLLAHQTGGFNSSLFASVVLLFLVMPLVPWGFREALLIVALVYLVFTTSTLSVEGRFDPQNLWILQFVMVGASLTTLVVISRNIIVRRNDIKTQYELELAHDRMELLSLKDPLTGAWNRRFLEQNFADIIDGYQNKKRPIYFAIIDINDFKPINDTYGHDYGDLVLKKLVKHFVKAFIGNEHLIRMGGDEFAVLMSSDDPKRILQQAADELRVDDDLFSASREKQVNLSIGVIEIPLQKKINLDQIYRFADSIMYQAKQKKKQDPTISNIVITPME